MPWLLPSFHPPTSCECLPVEVRDKEPGKRTLQGPDPHNTGQSREDKRHASQGHTAWGWHLSRHTPNVTKIRQTALQTAVPV